MNKAELRAQMTSTTLAVLGNEHTGETVGNVTSYMQEVLIEKQDDHAQKGTCSYYVLDEGQASEAAFWLKRHQNYVEPTPEPTTVEKAKAALDAAIGTGNYKFIDIVGEGDTRVVKIRIKASDAIKAFAFGADDSLLEVDAE